MFDSKVKLFVTFQSVLFVCILLISISIFLSCQPSHETDKKLNQNITKPTVFNPDSIWKQNHYVSLNQFRNQEMSSFAGFEEMYGAYESFIGNYERSRYLFDTISLIRDFRPYPFDSAIKNFEPKSALNSVLLLVTEQSGQAKAKNLILINEAHHRPEHRVFTTQLLEGLYKQGFRYLAVEGMSERDSLINERQYPNDKSGFYIQEICYANMLRKAMDLGFEIVIYDKYFGGTSNERDSMQAVNIYNQTFAKDENAKVLVHAGYGHVGKKIYGNNRPMGFMLSHLYGLSPFVINQTEVVEHKIKSQQSPNYQHITNNYEFDKPIILKQKGNKYWSISSSYDIDIIHPKLQYKNGRAAFLYYDNRQAIGLPKALRQAKYKGHLVRVFKDSEPSSAVPIDQFELNDLSMKMILPKGNYRIEVYNWHNQMVRSFDL